METWDDSLAVGRGWSDIQLRDGRTGTRRALGKVTTWLTGAVYTPHGIVEVYAQGDEGFDASSVLRFVHRGRLHIRNFKGKRYTGRGLARKARQFARQIVLSHIVNDRGYFPSAEKGAADATEC